MPKSEMWVKRQTLANGEVVKDIDDVRRHDLPIEESIEVTPAIECNQAQRANVGLPSGDSRSHKWSEDWLALRFIDVYGDSFCWTAGMDWMVWKETRWVFDKLWMRRFACARDMCRQLATSVDDNRRERLLSAKTIANILSLAKCDSRIIVASEDWDSDIYRINTSGGVVDLKTSKVHPNSSIHLVTKLTAVAPVNGDCPRWMQFLKEIFPPGIRSRQDELIDFVQKLSGYLLTGSTTEQKLFFLYGKGSNGKSVFLELLIWIMGDYGMKLSASALMKSRLAQHPTELAQLQGKRLAASSEIEDGQYWAESRIKELTGDETLSARYMRGDFFDFRQTQKHLIAGNYRPRLKGGDEAIQRRMVLIPFKAKFEGKARDDGLLDKLKAEGPQILHWMIQGAGLWVNEGLALPDDIRDESAQYMTEMDDIAEWVEDCCEIHMDYREAMSELHKSFTQWKGERGEKAPGRIQWRERLLQQYPNIEAKRTKKARLALGIQLNNEEKSRVQAER